jgi:hypothetical protein
MECYFKAFYFKAQVIIGRIEVPIINYLKDFALDLEEYEVVHIFPL